MNINDVMTEQEWYDSKYSMAKKFIEPTDIKKPWYEDEANFPALLIYKEDYYVATKIMEDTLLISMCDLRGIVRPWSQSLGGTG